MAKLPEIQQRGVITRGPQSSLSAAEIANPFQQIAEAFGAAGEALEKKEVFEAQTEGQNAVYRDASGNLQVDSRSNISASGRAYNAAAQQGYAARLAGDIRNRGITITNEAKGNVDTFDSAWKAFQDQTMLAVPRDSRGAVKTMLEAEGPRLRLGVSEEKRKTDLKEFEGNIKSEISLLDDDMSALARGGGTATDAYLEKQAQIRTLYQSLADNPDFTVGQKEADIALSRMSSRHMSEGMLGSVEKALNTGGIGEARKISEAILTDEKLALTPAERRQYAGLANERINGFVAQTKANLKPVQDQSATIQKRLTEGVGLDNDDIDVTARTLAAGGDLAGAMELYRARATAKTLQSFKLSDNRVQINAAEQMFSEAEGGGNLIAAMRSVESSGNANAESPKGASGDMQVMPATGAEIAAELGDANFPINGTDAEQKAYLKSGDVSTRYGTHHFNKMMARYGGDQEAALIAYNGGQQRADAWLSAGRDDSVIPKESADYYKKVLGAARSQPASYSPEEVTAARTFLQSRTDKDPAHIDGLDSAFAVKVSKLLSAAPPGIREKLGIYSGARSNERQAELYAAALKKYGSEAEARKWVAPPGRSQHNHGKAADLSYGGQSLKNAPADVVKWLHENAGQHGLKFPLGNENWHIEDDSARGGKTAPQVDPQIVKEYRTEITADAKDVFTDIKAGYDKGLTPAVSDLNLLTRQLAVVDDQDFRREVADYLSGQSAIAATSGLAPAQVESLISSLRSDTADGATIAQQDIITGMEKANAARDAALKADPLGYAVGQKMVGEMPALDLKQPDTWGPTFQSYQRGVDVLQARGMAGNVSALRPATQEVVSRYLETATPAEAVNLLGSMAQNMSPETYKSTLGKLAASGDGRTAAAAGALVAANPQAAEGVLRGRLLLKENPALAPKKTDDNRMTVDEILPPGAFAPALEGVRQSLLEAATARYADLSHQAGDSSGELSEDRMQQAVTEVTGGVVEMNGASVIAPKYGMTQDDFDASLTSIRDQDMVGAVTANGMPVSVRDLLSEGRLRAVADGRYVLEFGTSDSPTYAMRSAPHPGGGADLNSVFVIDMRGR